MGTLTEGFTPIAHGLLDALIGYPLSKRQYKLLLGVIRTTERLGKREADLSSARLAELTGMADTHCRAAVRELAMLGILRVTTGRFGQRLGINPDPATWAGSEGSEEEGEEIEGVKDPDQNSPGSQPKGFESRTETVRRGDQNGPEGGPKQSGTRTEMVRGEDQNGPAARAETARGEDQKGPGATPLIPPKSNIKIKSVTPPNPPCGGEGVREAGEVRDQGPCCKPLDGQGLRRCARDRRPAGGAGLVTARETTGSMPGRTGPMSREFGSERPIPESRPPLVPTPTTPVDEGWTARLGLSLSCSLFADGPDNWRQPPLAPWPLWEQRTTPASPGLDRLRTEPVAEHCERETPRDRRAPVAGKPSGQPSAQPMAEAPVDPSTTLGTSASAPLGTSPQSLSGAPGSPGTPAAAVGSPDAGEAPSGVSRRPLGQALKTMLSDTREVWSALCPTAPPQTHATKLAAGDQVLPGVSRCLAAAAPTAESPALPSRFTLETRGGAEEPDHRTLAAEALQETLSAAPAPRRSARAKPPTPELPPLPPNIPPDLWAEFLEHRRAVRSPMTPVAQRRALSLLARMAETGQDPAAVLEQSIVNGWRGLFPVRGAGPPRQPAGGVSYPAQRMARTVRSLKQIFGESDGQSDLSAGDELSGGGLRRGARPRAGGGVLGPARGIAR